MPEESEEQTQKPFDLALYLDIVRRRHIVFLTLLVVVWGLVWGSSWILPARYKSSTLILVEEPTMPKNYVVPNVTDDLQERLQSITQQILSRTRLLFIIDKLRLYRDKRHVLTPDEEVGKIRKDIDIELVRDPENGAITAFRIFYSASNPRIAQQVTGELTNLFIDENSSVREQESEDTTEFLQSQLANARSSLADQDAKVRAFQSAHQGALPSQQTSNLQILSGLQAELQTEQDALSSARQQRSYAQSLVDQYRAAQGTAQSPTGAPTGLAAIDQRLETLRTKLADLRTRYTDRYPEVQQVRVEIAKAEKSREQAIADLRSAASNKEQKKATAAQPAMDPVESAAFLQLQSQLQADQVEIQNREQAIANLNVRINDYQERLNEEPAVEQQLADLTRGYDQSQANYNDLLKKESDSQMATSMEQMQEGERFTMLDPPSLPLKPDFPNRLKICGVGVGAGLALGLLAVVLLEYFDDRLRSDKAIADLLTTSIISEVPEIVGPADEARNRRELTLGWAMAAAVLMTILASAAFSFLHA
ncbi:MAG TPA: hypothetical protein VME86_08415 [Acidobacteriaceae bacterium]|nr:hypothetical protein [Acidobacteriaceae bacterium]